MGIANRVVILSLTRMANYGLMLVSPLVLVRLLSVADFGRYREFLLYVGILQTVAQFGIPDSLLYFVATHPQSPWRVVRHNAALTCATTATVVLALLLADGVTHGALVGPYRWPLAACIVCSANLDFWECFWIAQRRPVAIFVYAGGRLLARLAVVITAAAVTHDVWVMMWGFVAVECVRLVASGGMLFALDRSDREPPLEHPWRDLLRYCMPQGTAVLFWTLSRNISNLAVVKLAGAAALAQYAIGRFAEPVVVTMRNSISTVVVPEMVHRQRVTRESSIALWQQGTVVNTILLFPVAVLVARYAFPLVTTVFGSSYAEGAAVMQLYMLVVVRECFDFAPPLRAAGRTTPFVTSNVASALVCGILLFVLVPARGVVGAMMAYAVGCFVDASYLGWCTRKLYGMPLRRLLPWSRVGKVALASALASVAFLGTAAPVGPPLLADAVSAAIYVAAYGLILCGLLRVPEAFVLLGWVRKLFTTVLVRGV
ncbi:MAG: lipopolysaccharide biosynthesis protein [Steroidobacteraceae bacterium]